MSFPVSQFIPHSLTPWCPYICFICLLLCFCFANRFICTILSRFHSSVQSHNCVWLFVTPWTATFQASLSTTNSQSLLKLMSTESVMPSNHLILCRHLFLLPSIFPSIRVFSNEQILCIRWPKYWSFSFSISPSKCVFGADFFRIWSPCSSRNSQGSSPAPQFKSINSLALSLLCSPTFTSIHELAKPQLWLDGLLLAKRCPVF